MGIVAITLLPDRPEMTSFFNEEERKLALERINRATSADIGFTINKGQYNYWVAAVILSEILIVPPINYAYSTHIRRFARLASLRRWHNLFRAELCECVNHGVSTDDYQNVWFQ
jgi:hypothetical protein